MRRVTWLVLIGAVCVGCAKKPEAELPNVAIEGPEQQIVLPGADPKPKTFGLNYAKLWDPKESEKLDPQTVVKTALAQRYFVKHQTEYLAPATVGSAVSLAQGGLHGIAAPATLAAVYPDTAKKFEAHWQKGITAAVTDIPDMPVLDFSTSGTGAGSVRVLVLRVKPGTDDELRIRFGEYITRVEEAVKNADIGFIVHQRGGIRILGSLSDIRYETDTRVGYVRSLVVRAYDEKDHELMNLMLGDGGKAHGPDLFKVVMRADNGPYLLVALKEQRR